MIRLLNSGFCRLLKSKLLWGISALLAIYGIFSAVNIYSMGKRYGGDYYTMDVQFFAGLMFMGIVMSVFASIFIGTDYSDGTIRNKIAAGHTRLIIYLSNLILIFTAGVIFLFSYCFFMLITGVILSLWFSSSASFILGQIVMCFMVILSYSAIFVFIAMLSQNRANSAVICMATAFILLISSSLITSMLQQPETYENYYYDEETGEYVSNGEMVPNPNYPRGIKRELLIFADEVLPSGQAGKISGMNGDTVSFDLKLFLYSAGLAALFTAGGALLFRGKDLK